MTHDADFDRCTVCAEPVKGTAHVTLGLFGVFIENDHGLLFTTDENLKDFDEWEEVPHSRFLHVGCVPIYFEAALTDLRHRARMREGGTDG